MPYRTIARSVTSAFLLLFLVGVAAAEDQDRIDPSKPVPSSAVVLRLPSQGSGFLVDRADRLLLTNWHVAQAGQKVDVLFPIWTADGQILVKRDVYAKKGKRIPGTCLASTSERDLAIIQLDQVPQEVPEVKLARRDAQIGDRVHLLGNPGKSDQVWVYGYGKVESAGKRTLHLDRGMVVKAQVLVLATEDRKIGKGASGGPAVNDRGELVGVIESGSLDETKVNCIEVSEVRLFLGSFYRKLGTEALGKKDYDGAVKRCTKAVDVNPGDALAYNERAVAHSFKQSHAEAIRDYSAAVKLDATMSRAYRGRATAHYNLGDYDRAVTDCSAAVKIDPQYAQAYLSRSRALEKLGRAAEAKADYEKAVKLDPSLK